MAFKVFSISAFGINVKVPGSFAGCCLPRNPGLGIPHGRVKRQDALRVDHDSDDFGGLGHRAWAMRHAGWNNQYVSGRDLLVGVVFQDAPNAGTADLAVGATVRIVLCRIFQLASDTPRAHAAHDVIKLGDILVIPACDRGSGRGSRAGPAVQGINSDVEFVGDTYGTHRCVIGKAFLNRLLHFFDVGPRNEREVPGWRRLRHQANY